jgi:hypothetical protein
MWEYLVLVSGEPVAVKIELAFSRISLLVRNFEFSRFNITFILIFSYIINIRRGSWGAKFSIKEIKES